MKRSLSQLCVLFPVGTSYIVYVSTSMWNQRYKLRISQFYVQRRVAPRTFLSTTFKSTLSMQLSRNISSFPFMYLWTRTVRTQIGVQHRDVLLFSKLRTIWQSMNVLLVRSHTVYSADVNIIKGWLVRCTGRWQTYLRMIRSSLNVWGVTSLSSVLIASFGLKGLMVVTTWHVGVLTSFAIDVDHSIIVAVVSRSITVTKIIMIEDWTHIYIYLGSDEIKQNKPFLVNFVQYFLSGIRRQRLFNSFVWRLIVLSFHQFWWYWNWRIIFLRIIFPALSRSSLRREWTPRSCFEPKLICSHSLTDSDNALYLAMSNIDDKHTFEFYFWCFSILISIILDR